MAISFYMDVHVPFATTEQLRRRGVDVLVAQEDGARRSEWVNRVEYLPLK